MYCLPCLGVGEYVAGPEFSRLSTTKRVNVTLNAETNSNVTNGMELIVAESGSILSAITLMEGTTKVKVIISMPIIVSRCFS